MVYSFLGWVMESAYGTFVEKKFINRGFLNGCFCPIYGFGALSILLIFSVIHLYIPTVPAAVAVEILSAIVLLTLLEYITGYVLEKIFHCKYWDYDGLSGNINGYVCLPYSLLWGFMAFVLMGFIHPFFARTVALLPLPLRVAAFCVIAVYFITDLIVTTVQTLRLKNVIINYPTLPIGKYKEFILHHRRIFAAFPHLQVLNHGIRNFDVRSILNEKIEQFKDAISSIRP